MNRCPYCGHVSTRYDSDAMWRLGACRYCADLPRLHAEANGETLPTMRAELERAAPQTRKGKVI